VNGCAMLHDHHYLIVSLGIAADRQKHAPPLGRLYGERPAVSELLANLPSRGLPEKPQSVGDRQWLEGSAQSRT
jgi:hypothetical protein